MWAAARRLSTPYHAPPARTRTSMQIPASAAVFAAGAAFGAGTVYWALCTSAAPYDILEGDDDLEDIDEPLKMVLVAVRSDLAIGQSECLHEHQSLWPWRMARRAPTHPHSQLPHTAAPRPRAASTGHGRHLHS